MTAFALIGSMAALLGFRVWKSSGNEHRLFQSLKLLTGTSIGARNRGFEWRDPFRTLALIVLIVVPALVLSFRLGFGMEIAEPVRIDSATAFTRTDLEHLSRHSESGSLPDLSDYVTHRAYQDALLYTQEWTFPTEGSGVTIPRYYEDEGRIVMIDTAVLSLDSHWFDAVMTDASEGGVGSLLLAQARPSAVGVSRPGKRIGLLRQLASAVFFLSPLLLIRFNLTSHYIYGMRNLLLRRKRQTA